MPTLRQVLPENAASNTVVDLLDVDVVAVRLNTGAPCSNHVGPFETWPGEGEQVRQWFVLANQRAVGIDEAPEGGPVCRVAPYSMPGGR